jgi:hypothetical protein
MFPSVNLTVISIIQALALEVLWSAIIERDHLWAWNTTALTGWLQAAAVFQVIFFLWLVYVQLVMRVRWVVTARDSLIPFVLGLAQFSLASLIDPDKLHIWFYMLAATAVFGAWINVGTERAARREPDNAELFAALGPDRLLTDLVPLIGSAVVSLAAGVVVQRYGASGALSAALVGLCNVGILSLVVLNVMAWKREAA